MPGRWKLTSRSASAGTANATGSLSACAPAGTVTPRAPPNVSGTGAPAVAAPSPRTATVAPPIRTGAAAKVFSNRSRARGPPAEVCTTSRRVRSVHGPTGVYPEVAAAQLPVQPRPPGRRDNANTCSARSRGSTTEATVRPCASGTVTTYSRARSASGPAGVSTCGSATALVARGPVRQSGAVSR